MIIVQPCKTAKQLNELVEVWEASVRDSHSFLTNKDIRSFKPLVKTAIQEIETLIIVEEEGRAAGFIGIADQKVEMLFLSPKVFGKGLGRQLMQKAIDDYQAIYVDVNEQNPKAVGFYQHMGFQVFARMEADGQGNPFPILNMKLSASW